MGLHIRHLRFKMLDYIHSEKIIGYHFGVPIYVIECDLIRANEEAKFLKEEKFKSPGTLYREENFFWKTIEYDIFINVEDRNKNEYIWKNMSQKAKNIIIDHELGHIFKSSKDWKFAPEEDADAYALAKNGKISKDEVIQLAKFTGNFYNDPSQQWLNVLKNRFHY